MSRNTISVLTTINAPYRLKLDEHALVACLLDISVAKEAAGPVSSFLGEVAPSLQRLFAQEHGITDEQLISFAKSFAAWSGEKYPLAA